MKKIWKSKKKIQKFGNFFNFFFTSKLALEVIGSFLTRFQHVFARTFLKSRILHILRYFVGGPKLRTRFLKNVTTWYLVDSRFVGYHGARFRKSAASNPAPGEGDAVPPPPGGGASAPPTFF